jgi:hypothetical protein
VSVATLLLVLVTVAFTPGGAAVPDPDKDGLPTSFERQRTGTDPRRADTDGDGVADGREDPDRDGLTNRWEFRLGMKPRKADTDGDGTPDGREDRDHDRLRNAWEARVAHTDPRLPDTDLDGLVDAVEDPDRDELSNAGEQRLGTRPSDPDSDDDDVDDWHEDSDGDGIEDGLTQDRRRVPSRLRPSLKRAKVPNTLYAECHQDNRVAAVKVCTFGPRRGRKVVLFGDSHALHWRRAFERVAVARGWRVWMITKSGCPPAEFPRNESCGIWRESAIRRIRAIHPWLIVVSEYNAYPEVYGSGSGDLEQDAVLWTDGLTRTLRRLDRLAPRIVLLGDISLFGTSPIGCLKQNRSDLSACSIRRADALGSQRAARDRAAAKAAGVPWIGTHRLSCPYDPCPLVTGSTLMAYNEHHLTVRYAELVWRGLAKRLPRSRG